jgi:hypothetical protein
LTLVAPFFFLFSKLQQWTQRKRKKKKEKRKTEYGEDEEVWHGLAKPTLWSPSPTL